MSPKKSKINITFDEETIKFLTLLALQENKSVPNMVKDLALEALAMRENNYLSKMVQDLENGDSEIYRHTYA